MGSVWSIISAICLMLNPPTAFCIILFWDDGKYSWHRPRMTLVGFQHCCILLYIYRLYIIKFAQNQIITEIREGVTFLFACEYLRQWWLNCCRTNVIENDKVYGDQTAKVVFFVFIVICIFKRYFKYHSSTFVYSWNYTLNFTHLFTSILFE